MHPTKRNCYYDYEKALNFFPVYSESNCALECAWKYARTACGCVPWFLVRAFKGSSPMCEKYGNQCFKHIVEGRYGNDFGNKQCLESCLPDCNEIDFTVEVGEINKYMQ